MVAGKKKQEPLEDMKNMGFTRPLTFIAGFPVNAVGKCNSKCSSVLLRKVLSPPHPVSLNHQAVSQPCPQNHPHGPPCLPCVVNPCRPTGPKSHTQYVKKQTALIASWMYQRVADVYFGSPQPCFYHACTCVSPKAENQSSTLMSSLSVTTTISRPCGRQ